MDKFVGRNVKEKGWELYEGPASNDCVENMGILQTDTIKMSPGIFITAKMGEGPFPYFVVL
jgi:hypothetical protein